MGAWWSGKPQVQVIRVIYVEPMHSDLMCFPVSWPATWSELQQILFELFRERYPSLDFEDAAMDSGNGRRMRVTNDVGFQALVPRHHEVSPLVQVYYVGLKLPRLVRTATPAPAPPSGATRRILVPRKLVPRSSAPLAAVPRSLVPRSSAPLTAAPRSSANPRVGVPPNASGEVRVPRSRHTKNSTT